MSTDETLGVATGGETISGAGLQAAIDALQATAKDLDADIAKATDVDEVQAIGRTQAGLNGQALDLVDAQIDLLAGQASVSALHINAAAQAAQSAIATMADWRKKIMAAGKLIDFFAAVTTGNGTKIVEAAYALKDVL